MEKSRSRKSDIYRVEKLLKQRRVGRRIEYLVKWKNWSDINNTWEPERNILDKRLIESFKRRLKRKDRRESINSKLSPPCLTPVIRSPEHLSTTTPNEPKCPLSLTLNAHVQPLSDTSEDLQRVSPCTPAVYTPILQEVDAKSGPCSSSTATSSEPPISPLPQSSSCTLNWEPSIWLPERRFRQSTLLVAAASASAAHTAAAMAISRNATRQTISTGQNSRRPVTPEPSSPEPAPSQPPNLPTTPSVEERPKIRLTIPRERILPCPPPGVPSSNSSSGSQNSSQLTVSLTSLATEDETDQGSFASDADHTAARFLAPTELPRRANPTVSPPSISVLTAPEVTIDKHISADAPPSPKWNYRGGNSPNISTLLPKLVVHSSISDQEGHRRRHQTDAINCSSPEFLHLDKLSSKRRRGFEKSKRKRHREQRCSQPTVGSILDTGAFPTYDILYPGTHPYSAVKIRRRSGSTASSLSSECCTPTTPNGLEEAPRLAPLRIQLPRSVASQLASPVTISAQPADRHVTSRTNKPPIAIMHGGCHLTEANSRNATGLVDRVPRLLPPEPNRLRLMQEICVTDVTVGDLTISIKECSRPEHFFGVPSRQLVYWVPSTKPSHTSHQSCVTEAPARVPSPTACVATSRFSRPSTPTDENIAPMESSTHVSAVLITSPVSHCGLKTIYEESTSPPDTSPLKPPIVGDQVSLTKLEPSETADISLTPQLASTAVLIPKSEPPQNVITSTERRHLIPTGETLTSPTDTQASPRLLTPPRRSSTPIHHFPDSTVEDGTPNMVDTASISSRANLVVPDHCDASTETSTDCVTDTQPLSPTLPRAIRSNEDVTAASWKPSRSKQATLCGVKLTSCHYRRNCVTYGSSEPPKKSMKSRPAVLPNHRGGHRRPIKPATTSTTIAPSPDDPASVYTFPDSSPTHNLPPRSVALRVLPNASCKRSVHFFPSCDLMVKGSEHPTASVVSLPSTIFSNGTIVAFSQTCSTAPSCTSSNTFISAYPPNSLGGVNCSSSETAFALCLEQLQMHLLFPDPNNLGHHISPACPFSLDTASSICATPLPASSTWQSLLPTTLSPFLPTSVIPADPSPLLPSFGVLPLSVPTTESAIPTQLQLADFMATAVATPTVFDVSYAASTVLTPTPVPDEAPIDLSAKR